MKLTRLLIIFVVFVCAVAHAQTYSLGYQKLDRKELYRIIADSKTTTTQHEVLISRANTYHLLEFAAEAYYRRLQKQPNNPVLKAAFGWALFDSMGPDFYYKPTDRKLRDELLAKHKDEALQILDENIGPKGRGRNIAFCWQAAAVPRLLPWIGPAEKAREYARKSLQLDPKNPRGWRQIAWSYLYTVSSDKAEPAKALAAGRRVVELNPNLSAGYSYQAKALFALRRYKEAYQMLLEMNRRVPPQFRDANQLARYKRMASQ
jgi:tetratricopeptide (TPR) repeat protein